jgi:release factor glutamine methyltransferase
MNVVHLIEVSEQRFNVAGVANARRVAEELVALVLDCSPLEIYLRDTPIPDPALTRLDLLANRIENGEPLQYVIGYVDFMGLEIKCDPRALIPRSETELLIEEVLKSKVWEKEAASFVDVGTGSGCIILALATQTKNASFTAVDSSAAALELARENAMLHKLEDQIEWNHSRLLDGFAPKSMDAVIANLPYIATADWQTLSPVVRDHEPQSALDSGPSGMELIEELSTQARTVLVPDGMLFLEFGYNQGIAVSQYLEDAGYRDVVIKQDLAGHDRMAIAINPPC